MPKLRKNIKHNIEYLRNTMQDEISWHIEFPTTYKQNVQEIIDRSVGKYSSRIWFSCTLDGMSILCIHLGEDEIIALGLAIPNFTAKIITKVINNDNTKIKKE